MWEYLIKLASVQNIRWSHLKLEVSQHVLYKVVCRPFVQVFESKVRLVILHPVYIAYPAGSAYISSYVVPADM